VGFFGFKKQVSESNSFKTWANANNVCGTYKHNGVDMLNVSVIEKFLEIKGYQWDKGLKKLR